ncbi:MAG: PilZ domain-containing protein [Candidatus Omnitrophota bacterium]
MTYSGPDRRKHERISKKFIVTYKVRDEMNNYDITQTKNVSLGGMLISTNRSFKSGTILSLETRLPFVPDKIILYAKVIESKEVVEGLIYDTRLCFQELDKQSKESLEKAVSFYLKPKD